MLLVDHFPPVLPAALEGRLATRVPQSEDVGPVTELLTAALRSLAGDPEVRATLPLGFTGHDVDLGDQVRDLADRLHRALDEVDPAAVSAALTRTYRSQQRAAPVGPLAQLAAVAGLTDDTVVVLRRHLAASLEAGPVLRSRAGVVRLQPDDEITVPLKNQDGQFIADEKTLDELEADGRVVFRYAGFNPNGSRRNIAGICNAAGNVVGLMPHPEHAVEPGYGPGPESQGTGTDGLGLFTSVLNKLVAGGSK